jgi:hypothetical protein
MEDMIRMLADAPEEQRKPLLKSRLEMLAAMPEEQRLNGMSEMITAVARLSPDKRAKLISTRNAVIAEFPPATRDAVMQSRIKLAGRLPKEVNEADMATMLQTASALPANLQAAFLESLKANLQKAGMPLPPMPGLQPPAPAAPSAPSGPQPPNMVEAQAAMMKQLAAAEEDMRRTALKGRWDEVLQGSDQDLANSVKVMSLALAELPDDQRRTLIRTRTEVIGSLPEAQIQRILAARARGLKENPKLDQEDRMIMVEELPWVPAELRQKFVSTMTSFAKSMNMQLPPMPQTPAHHGKPMAKKGLFSKRWECGTCGRGYPAM